MKNKKIRQKHTDMKKGNHGKKKSRIQQEDKRMKTTREEKKRETR